MSSSKTNKQTKQLRKKIMLSLMAAGVIGTVTLGASGIVEAKDIVAGGVATQYGATDISADTAIIGGWSFSGDNNRDMDHSKDTTSVTMNDGTARMIVGGSQIMNSNDPGGTIDVGTTNVVINKGTVKGLSKTGGPTGGVIGGNYIVADDTWRGSMFANTNVKGVTNVTINGGTFEAPIIAGSVAQNLGEAVKEGKRIVAYDDKTNLTVKGGTVTEVYIPGISYDDDNGVDYTYTGNAIYAGGAAMGTGAESSVKEAKIILDGLNNNVKLDTDTMEEFKDYVEVYGGGFAQAGATSTVENVTIDVINAKNIGINFGGNAISGPLTVPDKEDPMTKEALLPNADFTNIEDLKSQSTRSLVKNATVNIRGGQIWNLWVGGEGSNNYNGKWIQGADSISTVEKANVNYYGGMIGNIDVMGAHETTLNLYNDLKLDEPKYKGKYVNEDGTEKKDPKWSINFSAVDNQGGKYFIINGNGHALISDINVNGNINSTYEDWVSSAKLDIDNVSLLEGDILAGRDSIVSIDNIKEIHSEISGPGNVGIDSGNNLLDLSNTILAADRVSLDGGHYTGTYNLQNDVTVYGGTIDVNDFEKNFTGDGQFILYDNKYETGEAKKTQSAISTNPNAFFGALANDATVVNNDGAKKLPSEVYKEADERILFRGGSIILNTDSYSLAYAKAAAEAIKKADGGVEAGNTTKLTMRGQLADKELTIDAITNPDKLAGDDVSIDMSQVALDKVTISVNDGDNLVVSSDSLAQNAAGEAGLSDASKTVNTGFSVGALNLSENSKGMVVADQNVILGGNDDGEVLLAGNKTNKDLKVVVGLDEGANNKANFTIGNDATEQAQLTGSVEVNKTGTLTVNGDTSITEGVTVTYGAVAAKGNLTTNTVKVTGGIVDAKGDLSAKKVEVENNASIAVGKKIEANDIRINDSTVNTEGEIKADTLVVNRGSVDAKNGIASDKVYIANGEVQTNNQLRVNEINVAGHTTLSGKVNVGKLDAYTSPEGTTVQVGTVNSSAEGVFKKVTLNGATMILDPNWDQKANNVAVDFTKSEDATNAVNYIDGKLMIGQNTYATIGDTNDAQQVFAEAAKENTALKFGKDATQAALYIKGNQALGDAGAVYVNGAMADAALKAEATNVAAGSFVARDNTITMVDAGATEKKAALSGVKKVDIADKAKLYIRDAKGDTTYHILTDDGKAKLNIANNGWEKTDNLLTTNMALVGLQGKLSDDKSTFDVVTTNKSVKAVYGDSLVAPDVIDAANLGEDSKAKALVGKMTNEEVLAGKARQADALNGVANMVALSGASYATFAASNMLADSVVDHMSLANALTHDKDVWAKVIHSKDTVSDADLGKMQGNYDSKYNGIVVGADFYHHNNVTLGAAFSYVDGDVSGHTLATSTKDDAKYYGLSLYGGLEKGDYALLGDVSYLRGSHDVTQHVAGEALTSSFDTDAFSVGVRGEKRISYGESKFVPYVGARYVHLNTDNSANSVGLSYSQSGQNLFLIPVGVKYSADYKQGNWTIRPVAELGYVWNTGDRSVDQTVSLDGTANGFSYDVTDSGSFIGKVGIEATNGTITYGLDYEYQKGDTVKSNRYGGHINFKF